jgi:hypothetical protein
MSLLLLGLFALWSPQAHAQQTAIHLYSPSSSWKAGEDLTVFVYFHRGARPLLFMWRRILVSNRDFQVLETREVSGAREYIRDPQGFMDSQLFHIVFRVRLRARRNSGTLQYGPLRFGSATSNTLSFSQATQASSGGAIRTSVSLDRKQFRRGSPFNITLKVDCPRDKCAYNKVNFRALRAHFQRAVTYTKPGNLMVTAGQNNPRISYPSGTPARTHVYFTYQAVPLNAGRTQTPQFQIRLPILKLVNQRSAINEIKKWVQKTYRFSANKISSFFRLRQPFMATLNFTSLAANATSIEVGSTKATPGEWTLTSRVVQQAGTNELLWEVGLRGTGFIPLALQDFRKVFREVWKKAGLDQKVQLKQSLWRFPNANLGSGQLLHYFAFKNGRVALPGFSMSFSKNNGQKYTVNAPALDTKAAVGSLEESFEVQAMQNNLYLSEKPGANGAIDLSIVSYQLPSGFPTQLYLTSGYTLSGSFSMTARNRMKTVTQRRTMGPGMVFSSSRSFPINYKEGQVQVKKNNGPFQALPVVIWGPKRIGSRKLGIKSIYLTARTSQTKYFVGEAVEAIIEIHCPISVCVRKKNKELVSLFKSNAKLPNIDRFQNIQILENFRRQVTRPGWVAYRYRVRFRPGGEGKLTLRPTVLRLTRNKLGMLFQRHQVCLFRSGGGDDTLVDAIVADHMNARGGGCQFGTRELRSPSITTEVVGLPSNAQGIKLIGTFRLNSKLTQLTYPRKQATTLDKAFYLIVDLSGNGDLKTASSLLQDQVSGMLRKLRKESVSGFLEVSTDPDLKRKGIVRIQVQLIAEQLGMLKIPSLKLKYYHREEGVLTAQTLPLKVKVEPREGRQVVVARRTPTKVRKITRKQRQLASATDLRPNRVLGNRPLLNDRFELKVKEPLLWIFTSPMLFLFFLGWHRRDIALKADPAKQQQQKALKQFRKALSEIASGASQAEWAQGVLQATQRFLADRLKLKSRNMTLNEIDRILRDKDEANAIKAERESLAELLEELEGTIYGGGELDNQQAFLQKLESILQTLQRKLPQA